MAGVRWLHLCDHAFFDQAGKVCLIGIFGSILTARTPATHPRCSFVLNLAGTPGESVVLRLEVVAPGQDRPLAGWRIDRLGLSAGGEATSVITADNLPLPDFGMYEIKVFVNGSPAYATSFSVGRLPPAGELVQ